MDFFKNQIYSLNREIEDDKVKFISYSKGNKETFSNFKLKKLNNLEKRNTLNKAEIIKLENILVDLKNKSNIYVNRLKYLNEELFNENGVCKLDKRIKIINNNKSQIFFN
jgi:hypothetical protein